MRLTEVTQMALPPGRLLSFDLHMAPTAHELPVSFDQARHVGLGDRRGSWMALALQLPAYAGDGDLPALGQAWRAVVARHGTLRSVFRPGAPGAAPCLVEAVPGDGGWTEHHGGDPDPRVALRRLLDQRCRPYATPSHLLCVVAHPDGAATAVIAGDHAHLDMWSLAVLAHDLLEAWESLRGGGGGELPPAPAFAQHTRELTAAPAAPVEVREAWRDVIEAGGDAMPRFPLPLGELDPAPHAVVVVRDVLDPGGTAAAAARAREHGAGLLALALSALSAATDACAGVPFRAVFPVHSRHHERWHDSVGWFITNSVVEVAQADPGACVGDVRRALELGSWPLADVLAPWGGMPERPRMLALSWLDLRRLPVRLPDGLAAQYVSARLATDGVMVWFVVNESGLHLRARYPGTPEAAASVLPWLDDVVARIQAYAGA